MVPLLLQLVVLLMMVMPLSCIVVIGSAFFVKKYLSVLKKYFPVLTLGKFPK